MEQILSNSIDPNLKMNYIIKSFFVSPLEEIVSSRVNPVQVQVDDHLNTGLHGLDMDWSRHILGKLIKFGLFNKKSSLSIPVHMDLDLIFGKKSI